ncbi:Small RNA-binding protein 11, chloroplastic [Linum grandiflorum]
MTMTTIPTCLPFSSLIAVHSNPRRLNYCNLRLAPNSNTLFNARASLSTTPSFPLASRIVVKNLPFSTSESDLLEEFSNFGEVSEVKLVKYEDKKRRNAYAFIQYTCLDDAFLALENMDGEVFDGRMIYVDVAKPGRRCFGAYPTASGPPQQSSASAATLNEQDECWY